MSSDSYEAALAVANQLLKSMHLMRETAFDLKSLACHIPLKDRRERVFAYFTDMQKTGDFDTVCILLMYCFGFKLLVANDEGTLNHNEKTFCLCVCNDKTTCVIPDAVHEYLGDALMDLGIDPPMAEDKSSSP
jgi:hypothetical protein